MTEPTYTGPRIGDAVQVETCARVVELRGLGGVPGAVVELDPGCAALIVDGQPDGVRPNYVWLRLDQLVVLRPATP
jgi:hypothetical protein